MALNLKIGDFFYLVKRDEAIFQPGTPLNLQVNLGVLDCLIASRVFLPSGDYGLLGKAELTRKNQKTFLDLPVKFTLSDFVAEEFNKETKEQSIMICGTLELFDCSDEFLGFLESSKNVLKIAIVDFQANEENSTAKLIACTKK